MNRLSQCYAGLISHAQDPREVSRSDQPYGVGHRASPEDAAESIQRKRR